MLLCLHWAQFELQMRYCCKVHVIGCSNHDYQKPIVSWFNCYWLAKKECHAFLSWSKIFSTDHPYSPPCMQKLEADQQEGRHDRVYKWFLISPLGGVSFLSWQKFSPGSLIDPYGHIFFIFRPLSLWFYVLPKSADRRNLVARYRLLHQYK